MKIKATQTSDNLQQYLLAQGYHPTYFKGNNRGFYNPRNRQTMLVPYESISLSKEQILTLFSKSAATDIPPELEWYRFQLFLHSITQNK